MLSLQSRAWGRQLLVGRFHFLIRQRYLRNLGHSAALPAPLTNVRDSWLSVARSPPARKAYKVPMTNCGFGITCFGFDGEPAEIEYAGPNLITGLEKAQAESVVCVTSTAGSRPFPSRTRKF